MSGNETPETWVADLCLASSSINPGELLETIMADERCVAFGPAHHFIDGAVMLTAYRNIEGAADRDDRLRADFEKMAKRASCVPGAACANWGVCGAAAAVGMAYSIINENAPLKADGWSDGQLIVAHLLQQIAEAGSPRCCKRDSRIAVRQGTALLNERFGCALQVSEQLPVCASMDANTVCIGSACLYHPDHRS